MAWHPGKTMGRRREAGLGAGFPPEGGPGAPAPWFCYLLECADRSLYAGITTDLERRLAEHNRGTGSRYTRARLPVRLVWSEPHADRASASRRERELKGLPREAKLALVDSG